MPVANLQSYGTIGLRVKSNVFASQGQAQQLQSSTITKLQQKCGFSQVGPGDGAKPDVFLDLNITAVGRGGTGFLKNSSQATLDALLVLTDGQDGELLGTATVHGKSSGMIINGAAPENEVIDVVAQEIANMLAKSGCTGPRVARAQVPPPPGPGPGPGPGPTPDPGHPVADESHRGEAEALNDQGKEKLYGADLKGALASFQQANGVLPDAKYQFNVCLTFGAQEQWDNALAACKVAKGMNPKPALREKIEHRIDLLAHHQ